MFKQPSKNHLKNKYVAHINGPILFTAPHTKKLQRGGKLYKQDIRIHKRQIYTSFIACDLAKSTGKNSFMVWGKSSVINEQDLDPNYLMPHLFELSPFHQCLHNWAAIHQERPIFHVDIHGKMDRQKNCEIDVGIESIRAHWFGDPIIDHLINHFKQANCIFKGLKFGPFECTFNTDPQLHGYWGGSLHTMTQQAIMLGIPSVQLEIPRLVRKRLFKDADLRSRLAKVINSLYEEVVVPHHAVSKRNVKINKEIAAKFQANIVTLKEAEEVHAQIAAFEQQQQSNPNEKKHI